MLLCDGGWAFCAVCRPGVCGVLPGCNEEDIVLKLRLDGE
jgi:hypothetical protein